MDVDQLLKAFERMKATMDVYLKFRNDVITHVRDTLKEIVNRTHELEQTSPEDQAVAAALDPIVNMFLKLLEEMDSIEAKFDGE